MDFEPSEGGDRPEMIKNDSYLAPLGGMNAKMQQKYRYFQFTLCIYPEIYYVLFNICSDFPPERHHPRTHDDTDMNIQITAQIVDDNKPSATNMNR